MTNKPLKVNLIHSGGKPLTRYSNASSGEFDLVKSMPNTEPKAYLEPPLVLMESLNYKDKPSSLTYNTLYTMSTKNSVVGAIINTRVNQVSNFTKPSRYNRDKLGFEIRLRDPDAVPNTEQNDIILALETFIENCGYNKDNSRDSFDTFVRKIVRDSLTYDQVSSEILRDRMGRPAEFFAVDAATIRVASEDFNFSPYEGNKAPKPNEEVAFVQVIDGMVVAWFTDKELAFGVRNPRSSIYMQPYGFSELEQLVTQITSHLYAEQYNAKYFSQGGTTKGIINIKQDPNGIMNNEQLESFKRQWRAQVSGLTGAWKTPVLQVPQGIEYINVAQSNRDMEFTQWMNYLVNIACAIYQIDPAEINFPNNGGVSGTGGGLFESSNEVRLKNSKDKGLRPLLRFIEDYINKNIISEFSDEYVFNFVGMDEKSDEEVIELQSKEVKAYKTINEIRAEHAMEPIKNGDVILDPSWLNFCQQQAMMGGQEETTMDDEDIEQEDNSSDYSEYGNEDDIEDENNSSDYSEYGNSDDTKNTSEEDEDINSDNNTIEDYSDYNSGLNKSFSELIVDIIE